MTQTTLTLHELALIAFGVREAEERRAREKQVAEERRREEGRRVERVALLAERLATLIGVPVTLPTDANPDDATYEGIRFSLCHGRSGSVYVTALVDSEDGRERRESYALHSLADLGEFLRGGHTYQCVRKSDEDVPF